MKADTVLPPDWMPDASPQRIHVHWTAGAHEATSFDKRHYHFLIEGDGDLERGYPTVADNDPPLRSGYAAHTLHANSRAIGVSMCGMHGARERPFHAGKYPLTPLQWDKMVRVVAELCKRYGIPVTRKTVLTHAEVEDNLHISQRGKWDITRLPFDAEIVGARAVGDKLRADVSDRLAPKPENPMEIVDPTGEPLDPLLVAPVPGDRPATAVAMLRALGISRIAAIGLVGGFQQEAFPDLNTAAVGDNGESIGVPQWRGSRRTAFLQFCRETGRDWRDLEAQMRFVVHELETTEKTAANLLEGAVWPYSAAIGAIAFERPRGWSFLYPQGGHGWSNRLNYAIALDARLPR
ncbi:phage tail tip lysozyme [Methyloceanibacter caenitepidi]|uniref:Phage protein n=1 Tax=Methyloceanibacter caenitepidi TaxID=1384459 RepID=A0A0A8K1Y7_9HYPH|nr:phage tail tip lysozyme [Methyloceanibacter caenitepidi]BAQ16900.1 phage protein [Methyloceanibacter caenitepidi]